VKTSLSILISKTVYIVTQLFQLGAGGTWPGEIALTLNPNILQDLVKHIKKGIIVVVGTNGKTTTSLMIVKILEQHGYSVVHNSSGANLLNGVVSACIQNANWFGKLTADWGVFEVDENSLPIVISQLSSRLSETHGGIYHKPKSGVKDSSTAPPAGGFARNDKALILVLLNLFRDQLDRYGEVDVIAEKWGKALQEIRNQKSEISDSEILYVLNADDPLIAHLGIKIKNVIPTEVEESNTAAHRRGNEVDPSTALGMTETITYFGIEDKKQFLKTHEHATDSTFCLNCGHHLDYSGIYFSHLGIWKCNHCGAKRPKPQVTRVKIRLPGLYNEYNALAALSVAKSLDLDDKITQIALQNFQPAFGRQEEFTIGLKKIKLFLSKNPTGFNASLRTVLELKPKVLLLMLNDRIPDGRDVSWIWDVDFETIPNNITVIVSGDRVHDMALRIKYSQKTQNTELNDQLQIEPNPAQALETGLKNIRTGETLYVLPTYSAMLEVRKILGGKKIL